MGDELFKLLHSEVDCQLVVNTNIRNHNHDTGGFGKDTNHWGKALLGGIRLASKRE